MTRRTTKAWMIRTSNCNMEPRIKGKGAVGVGWSVPFDVGHIVSRADLLAFYSSLPQHQNERPGVRI
jgi:hypothetical protein